MNKENKLKVEIDLNTGLTTKDINERISKKLINYNIWIIRYV